MDLAAKNAAPTTRDARAVAAAIGALHARFGNRVVTSLAVREQHAILDLDENQRRTRSCSASADEVPEIVRIALRRVPVIRAPAHARRPHQRPALLRHFDFRD